MFIYLAASVCSRFSTGNEEGLTNRNPACGRRYLLRPGDSCRCSPTMEQETKALETQVAKLPSCYLLVYSKKVTLLGFWCCIWWVIDQSCLIKTVGIGQVLVIFCQANLTGLLQNTPILFIYLFIYLFI